MEPEEFVHVAFPPAFPVTPAQIDAQVAAFMRSVRAHPVLGPVFAAHVQDWPAHEAKIGRFWRNAILHERNYHGHAVNHAKRPQTAPHYHPYQPTTVFPQSATSPSRPAIIHYPTHARSNHSGAASA